MMPAATIICATSLAGCTSSGADTPPAPVAPPRVVFYAEGSGTTSGAITARSESGGTIQKDVALPLKNLQTNTLGLESTQYKRGAQLYLSVQNSEGSGAVTCRIEVDGVKIDEATSEGAYKIATCVGKVP